MKAKCTGPSIGLETCDKPCIAPALVVVTFAVPTPAAFSISCHRRAQCLAGHRSSMPHSNICVIIRQRP